MAHADLYYREIINNGKEACSGKNSKNTELTAAQMGQGAAVGEISTESSAAMDLRLKP